MPNWPQQMHPSGDSLDRFHYPWIDRCPCASPCSIFRMFPINKWSKQMLFTSSRPPHWRSICGTTAIIFAVEQAFAPSVLVSAWYSNNTPNESRRAVVAAVMGRFFSANLTSTSFTLTYSNYSGHCEFFWFDIDECVQGERWAQIHTWYENSFRRFKHSDALFVALATSGPLAFILDLKCQWLSVSPHFSRIWWFLPDTGCVVRLLVKCHLFS